MAGALLLLLGAAGIFGLAGWGDLRRLLIPNRLSLLLIGLYAAYALVTRDVDVLGGLLTGGAVFAVGFGLFAANLMGGGDVKLLAVAALWAGPAHLADLLLVTTLTGAVLALGLLTPHGAWVEALMQDGAAVERAMSGRFRRPMPYGVAIMAGGWFTLWRLAGF